MARLARVVLPGYPHHIIQRGNRRQDVFFRESDYKHYLELLAAGCKHERIEIWAYCLMANHVHLIVKPNKQSNLGKAIGETHRRYTRMITFILSITCSGKAQGVDGKTGEFIKHARRSHLWPEAQTVDRSAVSKARANLSHTVFESLLADAVEVAYSLWPESPEYLWQGRTVYAIDGSKYNLPATEKLREVF